MNLRVETTSPAPGRYGAGDGDVAAMIGSIPSGRVGSALREQRNRAGIALGPAAARARLRPDQLDAIESGQRRADVATVTALLGVYGCSLGELFPPRRPLDLAAFDGMSEAAILKHYVRQVRTWRRARSPQGFRQADLEVLIRILGTDPRAIEKKLRALTGCRRSTAKNFRRLLVVGLVAATAAVLAQGMASASGRSVPVQPRPPAATAAAPTSHTTTPATTVVCRLLGAIAAPTAPATPSGSGQSGPASVVTASVSVLAYVDVQVDQAGNPIAVRTNTGNGPECAVSWFVFGPQDPAGDPLQDITLADRVMTAAANQTVPAPGAWHPGAWYSLNR